jgi:hypothetical protein
MITGASRQRAAAPHWFRAVQRIAAQAIGIVRTWQKSGAARPDDFFTQFPGFATKKGMIVRLGRKWPEKRLV